MCTYSTVETTKRGPITVKKDCNTSTCSTSNSYVPPKDR